MPRSRGFSLIELLVSLALSALLTVAFFSMVNQFQQWNSNLHLVMERDENLRLTPLLLARYLSPAGNARWGHPWRGFEQQRNQLRIRSDLTGDDGFPDGSLGDRFERIDLRQRRTQLQMRINRGSYQPLLENVSAMEITAHSRFLLGLRVRAASSRPLLVLGKPLEETLELDFLLWNYRPNLFAEEP